MSEHEMTVTMGEYPASIGAITCRCGKFGVTFTVLAPGCKKMAEEAWQRHAQPVEATPEHRDFEREAIELVAPHSGIEVEEFRDCWEDEDLAKVAVRECAGRLKLEAENQEQDSILDGVGPIICRNGIHHARDIDHDCYYCERSEMRAKMLEAEALFRELRNHVNETMRDWDLRAKVDEFLARRTK